jgi:hypothetical protein
MAAQLHNHGKKHQQTFAPALSFFCLSHEWPPNVFFPLLLQLTSIPPLYMKGKLKVSKFKRLDYHHPSPPFPTTGYNTSFPEYLFYPVVIPASRQAPCSLLELFVTYAKDFFSWKQNYL